MGIKRVLILRESDVTALLFKLGLLQSITLVGHIQTDECLTGPDTMQAGIR